MAAAVTGVVLAVLMLGVRILLGEQPVDAAISAGIYGIGTAAAVFVIAFLARRPSSIFSIGPQVSEAVRKGRVPDDIDLPRWREVLAFQRRADIAIACAAPVVFAAFAILGWVWSADADDPLLFRVAAALFGAAAVAAPFLIRWELRKMEVVAHELRSRSNE